MPFQDWLLRQAISEGVDRRRPRLAVPEAEYPRRADDGTRTRVRDNRRYVEITDESMVGWGYDLIAEMLT